MPGSVLLNVSKSQALHYPASLLRNRNDWRISVISKDRRGGKGCAVKRIEGWGA